MQWLLDLLCEGFDDFVEERKKVGKDKPESTTTSEENKDKKFSLSSRASQTITLHTSQSSIVQAAAINDSDNGFKNLMIKILHCFGVSLFKKILIDFFMVFIYENNFRYAVH